MIEAKIKNLQSLIHKMACEYGRNPDEIQLLAVSKGQSVGKIREAFAAGIHAFGENYWQEAEAKILNLSDLPIHWHFIGPIQSRKAAAIAKHFDWVHSLDREKIAGLLSDNRPKDWPPLKVCIQINLDREEGKSGIFPEALPKFAALVNQLPHLQLRGLMTIPEPKSEKEEQYQSLKRLANLLQSVNQDVKLSMDTLSMGMSDDMVPAIRAGSTLLRIGRAIFGERTAR